MLQHYYPLLDGFITEDAIVIHVKPVDVFDSYRLDPFPFLANGYVLTLDLPASVVLVSTDLSQYAIVFVRLFASVW